jgi:hypothetical protein
MPNWCNNTVTISHTDSAKLEALAEAVRKGEFLKHVIPVPEDLNIVAGRVGADDNPEQIELERRENENLEKYGYKTWYDFCVNRWGTKWDVDAYEGENVKVENGVLEFGFDSAWSPPMGVYEELVEQGFEVVAYYYEPGMAYVGKYDNGCDDCYDYSGHDSKTVVDAIGEELDEMFGISESMREYEEEEKDEVQVWYEDGVEKKGLEPYDSK